MKVSFVISVLALALAASTPARADFAVVHFGDGHCQVWRDSTANPWGDDWKKLAVGLPDWLAATAALDSARSQNLCP